MDFAQLYQSKVITADSALHLIQNGQRIVAAMAAAEPCSFFEGLAARARQLDGLTVHCANPSRDYSCFHDPELAGHVSLRVMFLTAPVRGSQGHGVVHYVPQHLSQWTAHLVRNPVDIFWGSCSLPDERGFVSLGVGACYESEILRQARIVILEVNPSMPRTYGDTLVPLSQVTHFVETAHELPALVLAEPTDEEVRIARHVATLVPNGATMQLGIGGIPNAIGEALLDKRDLGVHTEMINDAMMKLSLAGVITGRYKTLWPGKMVGAFVFGTPKLYQFVDQNPMVELHPASVVNDPARIGRNHAMVSINTAIEVDLTGQVCSESVGHRELSGVGGAADTHLGAQRSKGGRGIIALCATTGDGKHSKIAFELKPGAKVSISRNDIDTVITEYGIAELSGASVAERVERLVRIADPRFRDELLASARSVGYV